MRIAITSPTGNVGRHLSRMLVRAGVTPLLLTRDPERIDDGLRNLVDVAVADSFNPDSVVAATRGVDALYWIDPPVAGDDPLAGYAQATKAVTAAVAANGIRRVVFQSSIGAEKRHGVGEIDGNAMTEVALDALDIDVTHLRCGYFFTNLLFERAAISAGALKKVFPIDARLPWVAPRDIAEVAALRLLNREWSGRHVQAVHGPEDLSWGDVAQILTSVLGHTVSVETISDAAMRQRYLDAGLPIRVAEAFLHMSTGLRDDYTPEQPRSIASTTPTRLDTWVREELA